MIQRWYEIVRFFRDPNKPAEVQKRNVTLKEAQEHCSDPDTHLPGVWFDGYRRQEEYADCD